jgi:hypothetical protein
MIILMRQKMAEEKRCPRCSHMNSVASGSWVEWQVLSISMRDDNFNTFYSVVNVQDSSKLPKTTLKMEVDRALHDMVKNLQ